MLVCDEARVVVPSDHLIKVDGILRELIYRLSEASDALGAPRTGLSVMMR
jgi:hypothetical protein